MRITKNHLDFWRAKKASIPTWASDLDTVKRPRPSIHGLINSQVERDFRDPTLLIERTLVILKSQQRRGGLKTLHKGLLNMSSEPGPRGAMCKRWLRRIGHQNVDFNHLAELLVYRRSGDRIAALIAKECGDHTDYSDGVWRINHALVNKSEIRLYVAQALSVMDAVDREQLIQENL